VLNSEPVGAVISGYIVDNHLSTHPIENVVIPKFNREDKTHRRLAELSEEAHCFAESGNPKDVAKIEKAIQQGSECALVVHEAEEPQ